MTKPLTADQLDYLVYLRDGGNCKGRPHGLLTRSCIAYKWGQNASMGYNLTPKGRRLLEEYEGIWPMINTKLWTNKWFERCVLPPEAAAYHRRLAQNACNASGKFLHTEIAEAWDAITANEPERVREAYLNEVNMCNRFAGNQEPGSELQFYWFQKAGKLATKASAL